jgi:hypothetical protein
VNRYGPLSTGAIITDSKKNKYCSGSIFTSQIANEYSPGSQTGSPNEEIVTISLSFDVSLTVHLSITQSMYQFLYYLCKHSLQSSTCFEQSCSSSGG